MVQSHRRANEAQIVKKISMLVTIERHKRTKCTTQHVAHGAQQAKASDLTLLGLKVLHCDAMPAWCISHLNYHVGRVSFIFHIINI